MAYCTNCGGYVEEGAKFCGHCGKKMIAAPIQYNTPDSHSQQTKPIGSQRETVFDGKIHKCPNCGATLAAFVKNCPECGYELRGTASTYSVQEFSRRYANATSNSTKIDLIRTFIVPNTKEDILEFIVLASSNIDPNSYFRSDVVVSGGTTQQDISDAWMAKFEQAHQKADLLLADDPYLEKIDRLYSDKKKAIESARVSSKRKRVVNSIFGNKWVLMVVLIIPLILLMFLPLILPDSDSGEKKLEQQVEQIEAYIEEGNYDSALTTAYSMSDNCRILTAERRS